MPTAAVLAISTNDCIHRFQLPVSMTDSGQHSPSLRPACLRCFAYHLAQIRLERFNTTGVIATTELQL